MEILTIGQLARRAGVGVETVRFYERKGLLAEPDRRPSGYRQYGPDAVTRLRFIRRAKDLGFTLKEIENLLSLRVDPSTNCSDIRRQAVAKIEDIQSRIGTLQKMKQALAKLTGECNGSGPLSECPILEVLDGEEQIR